MRGALLAGGAAVLLALTGCGRSDGPTTTATAAPAAAATTQSAAPATTTTVPAGGKVEVLRTLGGGRFDPGAIYRRESPGVVTIINTGAGDRSALPLGGGGGGALGSGFVISGDGEVATNAHVVTSGSGSSLRRARELYVRFPDGNQVPARIVGVDPYVDVALLKVDPEGLTLRPLPLGADAAVRVGAPVAAIGSPFGEEQSLSVGVVSARDRSIQSLTRFSISGAIQTDAAINHGNSGGPLLDAAGRVIGINSQIESSSGDGTGVGFAVPVDSVRRSLDMLRREGKPRYAYLGGESLQVYPQLAEHFRLGTDHGAWIQSVVPGGPAARAGLRGGSGKTRFQGQTLSTGGDVVTEVDGMPIVRDADVAIALQRRAPGDRAVLRVYRDGRPRTITVTLGDRPSALAG